MMVIETNKHSQVKNVTNMAFFFYIRKLDIKYVHSRHGILSGKFSNSWYYYRGIKIYPWHLQILIFIKQVLLPVFV